MTCEKCGEPIYLSDESVRVVTKKRLKQRKWYIFKWEFVSEKNYHIEHYEV